MSIEIILMLGFIILASLVYCFIVGYQQICIELEYIGRSIMRLLKRKPRPTKPSKLGEREAKW
jgi:hypothetical protein